VASKSFLWRLLRELYPSEHEFHVAVLPQTSEQITHNDRAVTLAVNDEHTLRLAPDWWADLAPDGPGPWRIGSGDG